MATTERDRLNYKDLLEAAGHPVDPDKVEHLFHIWQALSGTVSGEITLSEKEIERLKREFRESGLDPVKI